MKRGTAEQEQKGVSTPRPAAITLPSPSRRPESAERVYSGLKKLRTTPMAKTMNVSSIITLGTSYRKRASA